MIKLKKIVILFASIGVLFGFQTGCSQNSSKKLVVDKEVFTQIDQSKHSFKVEDQGRFLVITTNSSEALKEELHHASHHMGRCGSFTEESPEEIKRIEKVLEWQELQNRKVSQNIVRQSLEKKDSIILMIEALKQKNIEKTVNLLTSYSTRSAKSATPNKPIEDFYNHIKETLKVSHLAYDIERISHKATKQDSIKVTIKGEVNPQNILVLGGHIDSTTSSWFSKEAPGADDNASGSAVILETLRAIAFSQWRPKNTIEFYWYAGEENGLLGSKEIAASHASSKKNVLGVMQLDMVLYPGNGDTIGLTQDYTSTELNQMMEALVATYLGLPIVKYKCGYGCSDHAAWYQQGFKTVFPFESTFRKANKNIHTKNDVVDNRSSFEHALRFAKLGMAFLMEMDSKNVTPQQDSNPQVGAR